MFLLLHRGVSQGTAKLHYVVVRVFRTLLSKGLCSDETEEDDGEGEGDIQGMKVSGYIHWLTGRVPMLEGSLGASFTFYAEYNVDISFCTVVNQVKSL